MGGMLAALERGFVQREIQQAAFEMQKRIEKEEKIVVGVNRFIEENQSESEILQMPPGAEKKQIARLNQIRKRRNSKKVEQTLQKLVEAAHSNKNLFPLILEAVRVYASVGEIANRLRAVFGEHREAVAL